MNFLQTSEIKDPRISKFRLKATPSKVQRISSELQIVNATTNSMFPIDEKIINDYNISQKNNKTDLNPEDINMDYNKNDYNPAKIEELEEETPRQNQNPDLVPISRNESKASLYENEQNLEDSNNESEISEKNIVIQKENLEIASTNNVFCNKNLNFIAENTIKDFENVRLNEPSHKESPEINLEITLPEKSTHFANEKNLHQTLESEQKLSKDIEETINETNIRGKEQEKQLLEFDFKSIKCPKHVKEEIIFICNAPDCQKKFLCSKCLVDDMKDQTRHHIIHEAYLIPYDEHIFKHEYEKFLTKKSNFDKILNDQDYLLLEQIENGEVNSIIQKKYQNEVLEIEGFIENVNLRSNDVLSEYKNKIKENVAQDIQFFLRDIMNNFISMKDEFKDKTQKMKEIQIKSNEIFGKDEIEGSYEKIDFFLNLHQENLEDHTFQNFSTFLQASLKSLKEYTAKESNKALKYEFYINLMNALKIMINEKIPKNLLNPNFSLLLKTNVNISKEEWLKDKKPELFEQKNAEKEMIANKIHKTDKINQIILQDLKEAQQVFSVEKSRNNIIFTDYDKINSKYFYDLEYSLVLDICLLGPTEKNEYYVATCCSRERYIKIWLLPKDRPPSEYKSLEGHNKSTYKLFYCHEKKWLLSAGLDGSVKSWDMSKNFELGMYYKEERDPANSIAYNSSLDLFASSHTLFTRIWKIRKEYFVKIEADYAIQEPTDLLLLNFPNTEERCRLVIGNEKGELYFCDYIIGKNIRSRKEPIRAHNKSIWKLVFNQTRKYVISCCKDDNTIIFWDPYNMERIEEFTFSESKMIKGFFWNQSQEQIMISTGNNQIFFLEWQNNEHKIKKIYESDNCFGFNELVFLNTEEMQVLVVYTSEKVLYPNERKENGKKTNVESNYFIKYIYF